MGFSSSVDALWPGAVRKRYPLQSSVMPAASIVGAQFLGERVMARHLVMLADFLVQPQLPTRTLRPEILDLHLEQRINAREGIGEGGYQRPITKRVGRNGVNQLPPLR
jgi:hypothetical protein